MSNALWVDMLCRLKLNCYKLSYWEKCVISTDVWTVKHKQGLNNFHNNLPISNFNKEQKTIHHLKNQIKSTCILKNKNWK